jgi:hypothetical protein
VSAVQAQKNLAKAMQTIAEGTGDLNELYETQFKALKSVAGTKAPANGGAANTGGAGSPGTGSAPGATGTVATSAGGGASTGAPATSSAAGGVGATGVTLQQGAEQRGADLAPIQARPVTAPAADNGAGSGNGPAAGMAPSASQVNLNGNWMFRSTNRLTDPGVVVVEIKDAGEAVKGHLTMTMAPKSWGASQIDCDFSGPRTLKGSKGSPGAYTFMCNTSDRTGELHLLPNPAQPNLLEVVWNSKGNKTISFDQQLAR